MVNKLPVVTREPFRSSNLPEKKKKPVLTYPWQGGRTGIPRRVKGLFSLSCKFFIKLAYMKSILPSKKSLPIIKMGRISRQEIHVFYLQYIEATGPKGCLVTAGYVCHSNRAVGYIYVCHSNRLWLFRHLAIGR